MKYNQKTRFEPKELIKNIGQSLVSRWSVIGCALRPSLLALRPSQLAPRLTQLDPRPSQRCSFLLAGSEKH